MSGCTERNVVVLRCGGGAWCVVGSRRVSWRPSDVVAPQVRDVLRRSARGIAMIVHIVPRVRVCARVHGVTSPLNIGRMGIQK